MIEVKILPYKIFLEKNKIKQPTDLLSKNGFVVINKEIAQKYGLSFSGFISALLTKYQALTKSSKFMKNDIKEFWYTELDSKNDIGISYYIRKKCIRKGEELGLWKCKAKYNKDFPGMINKIDHFLIDWDNVVKFFMNLANIPIDLYAEDKLEEEAQKEEIKRLSNIDIQKNGITITDKDIEDFAEEMSKQKGIRSPKSYKLSIIDKALKNDKSTANKIKAWLKSKQPINKEINVFDEGYEFYRNREFIYQNEHFTVIGMIKKNNNIIISSINGNIKKVITVSESCFNEEFVYNFII